MKSFIDIYNESLCLDRFVPGHIHISYNVFLHHFSGRLDQRKVLAGAYMVYGWMPTMLKIKGPLDSLYDLANAARKGRVTEDLLTACAKTLNNSLVGTSKLMHFISPEHYPIWDSRVYRALFEKAPHPYRVENPEVYFSYISWVEGFENLPSFKSLQRRFEREAGYRVSGKRAAEAVLYALGGKPQSKESKFQ